MMSGTLVFALLATTFMTIEARSLTSPHHRSKREAWRAEGGQSTADWYRCHGQPCDQWEELQQKLTRYFRQPESEMNSTNGELQGAFDGISYNQEDGSLDGCIWLTNQQADDIIENMRREEQAKTRQGGRYKRKLNRFTRNGAYSKWDNFPIQYKFNGDHTAIEKRIIRSAFQHWMDNTCVTFKEVSTNQFVSGNHVLITRNNTGCHSYVGRVNIYPQQLNLQYNCLWEFGIVVHEIGHTLGLWHEQQRSDRDQVIQVLWENLGHYKGQFSPINTDNKGVPYDLGSVMHYGPRDGSSNGQNTMQTIDPLFQRTMGQKTGLSYLDSMIINRAYCSDTCRGRPLGGVCQRFGYQDPKDCSRCRCPPGFTGRFCEQVAPAKNAHCGGTVYASTIPTQISSPNYDSGTYENGQECNWLIKAPHGFKVQLVFTDEFGVYCHNQGQCYHWVEVRYSQEIGLPGPRFCCYKRPTATLTSETDEMAVIFRTNWTTDYKSARRGFKATYFAVPNGFASGGNIPTEASTTTTTTTTTTPPTTTTTTTTRAPPSSRTQIWSCDFESQSERGTWCGMTQDRNDQFDWSMTSGYTPSSQTGPDYAHTGRFYIFIEASNPQRPNDQASVFLPPLKSWGEHCVEFSYHMYGYHINTLALFHDNYSKSRDIVWSKRGEQGNRWITARATVSLRYHDRLGFTGVRGNEYSGDIALDSIRVTTGRC